MCCGLWLVGVFCFDYIVKMFCFDGDPHLSHFHHSVNCLVVATAASYAVCMCRKSMHSIFLLTTASQEAAFTACHVRLPLGRNCYFEDTFCFRSNSGSQLIVGWKEMKFMYVRQLQHNLMLLLIEFSKLLADGCLRY